MRKVPTILQLSDTECGIAALAMIFAYYDFHLPMETLREQCGTSRDGSKAATLIKVAENYGFNATAFKVEFEEIYHLKHPVIAFWNFSHYVIITKAKKNKIHVIDPAIGAMTISPQKFDLAFTGVIIDITVTHLSPRLKSKSCMWPFIKKWLIDFKLAWSYIFLVSLLMVSGPLLSSAFVSVFINYCLIGSNSHWLPWIALLATLSAIIFITAAVATKVSQFKLGTKAGLLKLSELALHLLKLATLFYALRQKNEIITIINRAETILTNISKSFSDIGINFLLASTVLLIMLKINLSLAFISMFIASISTLSIIIFSKYNLNFEKANMQITSKLYSYTMSSIRNMETIKASAMEEAILTRWKTLFSQKLTVQDKLAALTAKIDVSSQFTQTVAMLVILYFGILYTNNGKLSLGLLMGYYSLHLFFCKNLLLLAHAIKDGQGAYVAHDRINDIQNQQPDIRYTNRLSTQRINKNLPIISCQQLEFNYNHQTILQNIHLDIQAGQQIALVGTTGSGKSTLAKILCGLLQPQVGKVLFYDKSYAKLTADEFARYCAYVSQDISLFAGTLYENLTLWHDHYSFSQVNFAIQQACLQNVVGQRGLYANVSEQGNNFSGGEKQRIEIARALLQDTPLLILDEATSALDINTERELINNLRESCKTIIYVAHRLSSIQHCDQILMMHQGKIIERGTHNQLLQQKQYYYQLIENQFKHNHAYG